ncbi:MAG: ribosomal-processing cysteine protease Prp [Bacillota bacterium]
MITAIIYRSNPIYGSGICAVEVSGHAGFGEEGRDIVCASVSVLVITLINGIETFTETPFSCRVDEENGGYVRFELEDGDEDEEDVDPHDSQMLLNVLLMGLQSIAQQYKGYITIEEKEV